MPIFPFIAGLAAGVVAVRLYKNEQFRAGIASAGQKLRQRGSVAEDRLRRAAASGLGALADSSARLRDRLQHEEGAEAVEAAITLAVKPASGKRKPAARAAAKSVKPAAKTIASVPAKGRK
ncbi:MAG: hypothetical protein LBF93_06845 [Zoogloeaceae bacterium]|jgi:acetylornithine/succinyldiaminopimelate/putrescine aminotransferase|nr:hypothetical protein [Zoogloeaceae bacterium]